jgi:hypothetical protein
MTDDLEAGAYIFQHLGNIFAERAQLAAAAWASIVVRHVSMDLARQVLGKWPAKWFRDRRFRGSRCDCYVVRGTLGLELFKLEFELLYGAAPSRS